MNALMQQINKLLAQITVLRRKLILKKCNQYLGVDASPNDIVDDVVGCVESVTQVLKQSGVWPGIDLGTYTMWKKLAQSKNWVLVTDPQPADVVISPTGLGNGVIRGHVGIVGQNNIIYSNNSYTGTWSTHYNIKTWNKRYKDYGGFPVYYFRYISVL